MVCASLPVVWEIYFRNNSLARKRKTTQYNPAKLNTAKVNHWNSQEARRSVWKKKWIIAKPVIIMFVFFVEFLFFVEIDVTYLGSVCLLMFCVFCRFLLAWKTMLLPYPQHPTHLIVSKNCLCLDHNYHLSLNREGRWGTIDDFVISFQHFPVFSTALWCCLPTSSCACLVFFLLSLCFARWFWADLMNERHDHTTAACVSLRWSGGLRVVQLPAGSWHGLPRW